MAAITSYETLQTAVADYCARSDLTTFVPNFVQNWEEAFFRQPLNWGPWMESALSVTMAAGIATLPADYLGLKWAATVGSPNRPLSRKSAQTIYQRYPRNNVTGRPIWIGRDQGSFVFGPMPDSNYAVVGAYYAKPALLRNDSDGINWLVTNAPDLILFGSLLEAEPFLKNDSRIAIWMDRYTDSLVSYRDMIRDEESMGSAQTAVLG